MKSSLKGIVAAIAAIVDSSCFFNFMFCCCLFFFHCYLIGELQLKIKVTSIRHGIELEAGH